MKRLAVALVLVAALSVVYFRVPSSVPIETANAKGSPTAPIEIEEWGDFG